MVYFTAGFLGKLSNERLVCFRWIRQDVIKASLLREKNDVAAPAGIMAVTTWVVQIDDGAKRQNEVPGLTASLRYALDHLQ